MSGGFEYLKDRVRWQIGMMEELERLRENHPKIQEVVLASSHTDIADQNSDMNKWLWQLRDAIDEADDVLDEFERMKHEKQRNKNKEQKNLRSTKSYMKKESTKQEQQEQLIELWKFGKVRYRQQLGCSRTCNSILIGKFACSSNLRKFGK